MIFFYYFYSYLVSTSKLIPFKHGRNRKSNNENEMSKSDHKDVVISDCGLFIDKERHYFGTSPDLLITCSCCGEGVVEIKCSLDSKCGTCSKFCL